LILKESLIKNKSIKDINLFGIEIIIKIGNDISDQGCEILNEIFLENKIIERINLNCKSNKI
jgi:hypothetical protein